MTLFEKRAMRGMSVPDLGQSAGDRAMQVDMFNFEVGLKASLPGTVASESSSGAGVDYVSKFNINRPKYQAK